MGVYVRMIVYFLAAAAASQGLAVFDPIEGTITIDLNSLALAAGGVASFVGTFVVGRIFKARGGAS